MISQPNPLPPSDPPARRSQRKSHRSKREQLGLPIDPLQLPPSIVQPLGKRFCNKCHRYKFEHCFTTSDLSACDTCLRHEQELRDIVVTDPDYDQKLAKIKEEMKREIDEINLPRLADLLTEFWAQEGGVKESIAKIRHNLNYLDNFKPGSATAMNLRMGMLKLQVAYEAVQLARAKQEKMPSVQDAMAMVDEMLANFAKVATGKKVPMALEGIATDDGQTIDMDMAKAKLAEMVRVEEDEEEDDLELLLGKAADDQGKDTH